MAISFACESCGKSYTVVDEHGGKKGRCKQCGHIFHIPAAPLSAAPRPASKPAPMEPSASWEEDEPALPRYSAPAAQRRKKKAKRRSGDGALGLLPGIVYLIGLALLGVSFVLAFVHPLLTAVFIGELTVVGILLWLIGGVLALIIPFRESATCGLCYIFVPFYGLYYLITRWQDMKYAFGMSFLGALCLI
jgi:hypothetical protein